jgi:hypothetical protein
MRAFSILLLIAACHHDSTTVAPVSTADQDALWKLAPDGAVLGIVATPRALGMVEHAWGDVRAFMGATPELAPILVKIGAAVGAPDLSLASVGLTATKGAAVFFVGPGKAIAIVPLADRDKFLAAVHGMKGEPADTIDVRTTCRTTHGVYACASEPALFDRLGKGDLTASAAGARGDIELAAHDLPIEGRLTAFAAVAQLERGAVTLRGALAGLPTKIVVGMGSASKPRVDGDRTTGFAIAHLKGALALLPVDDDSQLAYGVKESDIVNSIDDPFTVTMQSSSFDARLPLSNVAALKTLLIEHCTDGPLKEAKATLVDGVCHFAIPDVEGEAVDLWLDGNTLRIGQKAAATGAPVELTPIGKEIASQPWQAAVYGRGSLLAAGDILGQQAQLQQLPADMAGILHVAMRGLAFVNEIGVAARVDGSELHVVATLRTAWSNPDDVVAKLLALDPDALVAGKGLQLVKPIVDAAPNSPLASDIRAGYGGLALQTAVVGVLAAVAVPAFLDYMQRAKQTDVTIVLGWIGRNLVREYGEDGTFPIGDAPLLPLGPCCGQPGNKCPVDPAAFGNDKVWTAVGFSLDAPSAYQFRYHSDGKTAQVQAVGDLDCDGEPAIYTLRATVDPTTHGAVFAIEQPASGVH